MGARFEFEVALSVAAVMRLALIVTVSRSGSCGKRRNNKAMHVRDTNVCLDPSEDKTI